jgi:steroid delta-isomerase-like uncharacterized protein
MSTAENKERVWRAIDEVWNKGNLAAIDAFFAGDAIEHDVASTPSLGADDPKEVVAAYRRAFPDVQVAIEDQIAEGDQVLTRWTARATQLGAFLGLPPSGRSVVVTGMWLHRLQNGKVVESWENVDLLGLLQQIGALPAMSHRS